MLRGREDFVCIAVLKEVIRLDDEHVDPLVDDLVHEDEI